jgi:hypothetical protein
MICIVNGEVITWSREKRESEETERERERETERG